MAQIPSPITGLSRQRVLKLVNHALDSAHTSGIYRDQYWRPIQAIWKALEHAGLPFSISGSQYEKEHGVDVRKVWTFEVPFTSERGKPGVIYGRVVAAGAGSVEDPLDSYDVTAYAS